MNISLAFLRVFFMILSIFFMTVFMVTVPEGSKLLNGIWGVCIGIGFGFVLYFIDTLFRRCNLRAFNVAVVGLFFGYLMGQALVLIFAAVLAISAISIHASPQLLEIVKISLFLFGLYLGTLMTMRSSDEIYVSIPFVKFAPSTHRKKDLIVDLSALGDSRLLDLVATGLLDHQLVVPRFVIKELYALSDIGDETGKSKARRALETLKKLEVLPDLALRLNDTDFPDVREMSSKLIRLARLLDANLLTADITKVQMAMTEEVKVINIHTLANALKPFMQAGEVIKIRVQRCGKEPRQGVGYLEDGTMVVVNGGGDYIGDTIEAQVITSRSTTSGRMIFCNAMHFDNPPFFSEHHPPYDDER